MGPFRRASKLLRTVYQSSVSQYCRDGEERAKKANVGHFLIRVIRVEEENETNRDFPFWNKFLTETDFAMP